MLLFRVVKAMYITTIMFAVINMCTTFEVISFGWLFSMVACLYSMVQLAKGDDL